MENKTNINVEELKTILKVKPVKVEKVKVAKPEIIIKDLVISKDITIKEMKTCVVITNTLGNKWYLKGHTLEITKPIPELADRTIIFSKEVIAKCHLGHVTCVIKNVADTKDLQSILKHFKNSEGIKKIAKEEIKKPKVKAIKEPKVKAAKKTIESPKLELHAA
jgi:hypothetical protein